MNNKQEHKYKNRPKIILMVLHVAAVRNLIIIIFKDWRVAKPMELL